MKIDKVIVGSLKTNCYIISKDNKCLIIDPGDEYLKIKNTIGNKTVVGVLVTHHHFDHVGALNNFDNIYDYHNLKEGINKIDIFTFEVIYTPGHTSDSISFYFKELNAIFDGDFIFKNGIGRTDLGGDIGLMYESLNKINKMNNDIKLYPGHGDGTNLKKEMVVLGD